MLDTPPATVAGLVVKMRLLVEFVIKGADLSEPFEELSEDLQVALALEPDIARFLGQAETKVRVLGTGDPTSNIDAACGA